MTPSGSLRPFSCTRPSTWSQEGPAGPLRGVEAVSVVPRRRLCFRPASWGDFVSPRTVVVVRWPQNPYCDSSTETGWFGWVRRQWRQQ